MKVWEGTWRCEAGDDGEGHDGIYVIGPTDESQEGHKWRNIIAWCSEWRGTEAEPVQNAALIAAAPELYRALEATRWHTNVCSDGNDWPKCAGCGEYQPDHGEPEKHDAGCVVWAALRKARVE